MNFFEKSKNTTNSKKETEVLFSSPKQNTIIEGIELPDNWKNLNTEELHEQARQSILELSRSSNSDFKAKELGFNNAEHLMQLCFNFILK